MPKRNTLPSIPDYKGIGNNSEKFIIQKSNPLQSLSQTAMTLAEFKILDAYLARIDSHNPDKRCVQFEKGELERLLDNTRMHRSEIEKRIDNLFQVITVQDEKKTNGFTKFALFVKAECFQDKDKLWKVNLTCSEEAMEYIFNVEKLGYLKYRLRNVVNFTSRYSYFLYLYLEDNIYRKTFEVEFNELKIILNCNAKRYNNEFKFFNAEILKKAQKEILKNTDLSFAYSTIKCGRRVVAIKFEVERVKKPEKIFNEKKPECEPISVKQPECISLIEEQKKPNPKQKKPVSENFHQTTMETDFTPEQIENLCYMLEGKLDNDDLVYIKKVLQGLYADMKLSAKGKINDPMAYIKKMIKNLKTEPNNQKNNINSVSDIDKYKFVINNIPEPDQEEYDDEWYKEYETINK